MDKKNYVLPILALLCVIAVIGMVITLSIDNYNKNNMPDESEFIPPHFDPDAQSGMPEVSDKSWSKIYREGMSFTAWICGNVNIIGGSADLYFTNVAENTVWLKLRIVDENGDTVAETGIVKPNEYVKSVKFDPVPAEGAKIEMQIMAYEPDNYYSAGAVKLNTTQSGEDTTK